MTDLRLERLYELTVPGSVALSPSGDRVAVTATEYDATEDRSRTSLFVVPTDGSRPPHRLARASDASTPRWSPDGTRLGFVAARDEDVALTVGPGGDDDDDDEPNPQVWAFDTELGGDARQLTDFDEGVRNFDWSPDGDRLVVDAPDPTDEQADYRAEKRDGGPIEVTRLQHKRDGAGWLDDVDNYLFVVDRETREVERLDDTRGAGAAEPLGGLQPAWGKAGIAFLTNRTEWPDDSLVSDVFLVQPDGSECRQLTEGMGVRSLAWSPDGSRLAFAGRDTPANWYRPAEVYVADPATAEYESVSGALDRTLGWDATPQWASNDELLFLLADEGRTRLARCHADGSDPERIFEALPLDHTLTGLSVNDEGDAVVLRSGPGAPPDVHVLDGDPFETTQLTAFNETFVADTPHPNAERFTVESTATLDGEERTATVSGWAFLPDDFDAEDPDPRPLVAFIHGGPMSYDTPEFDFKRSYFTARGYVAVCVDYRGSTSYGRAFAESLRGSRGALESADVMAGVDEFVERGWADPDRLFCTGFSYGGITSAHIAVRDNPFAAIAPEHGIYDFYSNFGTDDNHTWHDDEFGLPWEEPETYREISSITRVDEIDTPLLVTAGEHDWRCPPTQAEQLYVSVRKQGVDAKLVIYQDEHHNVGAPERAIHRLRSLEEWFRTYDPAIPEDEVAVPRADGDDEASDGE